MISNLPMLVAVILRFPLDDSSWFSADRWNKAYQREIVKYIDSEAFYPSSLFMLGRENAKILVKAAFKDVRHESYKVTNMLRITREYCRTHETGLFQLLSEDEDGNRREPREVEYDWPETSGYWEVPDSSFQGPPTDIDDNFSFEDF